MISYAGIGSRTGSIVRLLSICAVVCALLVSSAGCAATADTENIAVDDWTSYDTNTPAAVLATLNEVGKIQGWDCQILDVHVENKLAASVGVIETDCVELEDVHKTTQILEAIAILKPDCAANWEVFGPDIYDQELVFLGLWSADGPQLRDTRELPTVPVTPDQVMDWLVEVFEGGNAAEPWVKHIQSVDTEALYGYEELVIRTDYVPDAEGREMGRLIGEAIRLSHTPLCEAWTVLGMDDVVVISGAFEVAGNRAGLGILADGYVY